MGDHICCNLVRDLVVSTGALGCVDRRRLVVAKVVDRHKLAAGFAVSVKVVCHDFHHSYRTAAALANAAEVVVAAEALLVHHMRRLFAYLWVGERQGLSHMDLRMPAILCDLV